VKGVEAVQYWPSEFKMHATRVICALAAALPVVQGHFTFVRVAVNGDWQAPFQFIRNKTAPFEEPDTPHNTNNTRGYHDPTFVTTDYPNSARCGRDNMAHAADTEVLKLKAGDTVEFVVTAAEPSYWTNPAEVSWNDCPEGRGFCSYQRYNGSYMTIIHDGPVVAHLSKVPSGVSVHEYDGSGDWVKIHTTGLEIRKQDAKPLFWLPHNNQFTPPRFIFKVPKQTPAGQYLLRVDLIWPGLLYILDGKVISDGEAQLYPSCAQIEVESEATEPMPQGISIPEDLGTKSPGCQVSIGQYRRELVDPGYVYPGGPLWDGEKLIEDVAPSFD
jgi:hypothetical protein